MKLSMSSLVGEVAMPGIKAHLYFMKPGEKKLPLESLPKTRHVELYARVSLSFAPTQYATDILKVGSCHVCRPIRRKDKRLSKTASTTE